jgi:hypothetical protein
MVKKGIRDSVGSTPTYKDFRELLGPTPYPSDNDLINLIDRLMYNMADDVPPYMPLAQNKYQNILDQISPIVRSYDFGLFDAIDALQAASSDAAMKQGYKSAKYVPGPYDLFESLDRTLYYRDVPSFYINFISKHIKELVPHKEIPALYQDILEWGLHAGFVVVDHDGERHEREESRVNRDLPKRGQ